jgi:hypothetical protein
LSPRSTPRSRPSGTCCTSSSGCLRFNRVVVSLRGADRRSWLRDVQQPVR